MRSKNSSQLVIKTEEKYPDYSRLTSFDNHAQQKSIEKVNLHEVLDEENQLIIKSLNEASPLVIVAQGTLNGSSSRVAYGGADSVSPIPKIFYNKLGDETQRRKSELIVCDTEPSLKQSSGILELDPEAVEK